MFILATYCSPVYSLRKKGNGQSIKIWNTEKVTAIRHDTTVPCSIRHFPAAASLQMCLALFSL